LGCSAIGRTTLSFELLEGKGAMERTHSLRREALAVSRSHGCIGETDIDNRISFRILITCCLSILFPDVDGCCIRRWGQ